MPVLLFLLVFLAAGVLHAQPDIPAVLRPAAPAWAPLELSVPPSEKQQLLDAVFRNEELRMLGTPTRELLGNAHIVDIDLDGRADVVYHGTNGSEIKRLVVFVGTDTGLVRIAALWGELLSVQRNGPLEPLSFTLVDYPCCAGYTLYNTVYNAVRRGTTVSLEPALCTAFTSTTTFPTQFTTALPFAIGTKAAELRAMPEVSAYQPERLRGALPNPGNLLGVYPEGSLGIVLAEHTNASGERWLFVRLARNLPAQQDIVHRGQNSEEHFGMLGWMRAEDTR